MSRIILTEEQAKVWRQAADRVELCDPQGKVLATIDPDLTPEFIAELKRRAREPGPRYTGAQVQARLKALETEWSRIGSFDEAYMKEFLKKLDEEDPPARLARGERPMSYTVDWAPNALSFLTVVWLQAADRQAITTAQNKIDRLLASNPLGYGQLLSEGLHFVEVHPLRAVFEISQQDRRITVVGVSKLP